MIYISASAAEILDEIGGRFGVNLGADLFRNFEICILD